MTIFAPMATRNDILEAFSSLGDELAKLSRSHPQLAGNASRENPWFTPGEIYHAAGALSGELLDRAKLEEWASGYGVAERKRTVAVVMAGNIPFAGLFDLLCVLVSGHGCLVKYSSRDRTLMEFVVAFLKKTVPGLPVAQYIDGNVDGCADAAIASGSDNAIRHIKSTFGEVPALYRGNRSSAAILDGGETAGQLAGLADDVFTYSGLGCRSVSHLLLPESYPLERLLPFAVGRAHNPKYLNNYRQQRAVLTVSGEPFTDCGSWILRPGDGFSPCISEVTYGFYRAPGDASRWVRAHESELQCVVASAAWSPRLPFPPTPFGRAQFPALGDYPDRTDTMAFLLGL